MPKITRREFLKAAAFAAAGALVTGFKRGEADPSVSVKSLTSSKAGNCWGQKMMVTFIGGFDFAQIPDAYDPKPRVIYGDFDLVSELPDFTMRFVDIDQNVWTHSLITGKLKINGLPVSSHYSYHLIPPSSGRGGMFFTTGTD